MRDGAWRRCGRARTLRVMAFANSPSSNLVVITGGTSGIGYHLARAFIGKNFDVIVSSRDETRVRDAVRTLREEFGETVRVSGVACDVSNVNDVEALQAFARERLIVRNGNTSSFDVVHWVNAAGMVTKNAPLHEVDAREILSVVGANLIGPLLGCKAAIALALDAGKSTRFVVWNFGFSSWGVNLSRSAATHKSSKAGLTQLTKSLNEEVKKLNAEGRACITFHQLSPGLSLTKLLLKDASSVSKKVFNALAEEPDDIATFLADEMCSVEPGSTAPVEYLTPSSAVSRMIRELPNIITNAGGRHFDANGARVKQSNAEYDADGVRRLPFDA